MMRIVRRTSKDKIVLNISLGSSARKLFKTRESALGLVHAEELMSVHALGICAPALGDAKDPSAFASSSCLKPRVQVDIDLRRPLQKCQAARTLRHRAQPHAQLADSGLTCIGREGFSQGLDSRYHVQQETDVSAALAFRPWTFVLTREFQQATKVDRLGRQIRADHARRKTPPSSKGKPSWS